MLFQEVMEWTHLVRQMKGAKRENIDHLFR